MAAGERNVYSCQSCEGQIVTIDTVDGTTPFQIGCRATEGCDGGMFSSFYRVPDDAPQPSWEWYRPTNGQAKRLDRRYPGTRQHVQRGGLLLRRRSPHAPPWKRAIPVVY